MTVLNWIGVGIPLAACALVLVIVVLWMIHMGDDDPKDN